MPYFIKRNHGTETPASYLFWAVHAVPAPIQGAPDCLCWKWKAGAAVTLRMEKGEVTRRKIHILENPDKLWELIAATVDKRRPLYCIGYGLAHTWRLSGGWEWLEKQNPGSWRIVIANPPIMFRGKVDGCSVAIMDAYNWFPLPLDEIGNSLQLPRHPGPSHTAYWMDGTQASLRDCEIMERCFTELVQWWRVNDLGVLGKTIAGCSMNAYRHRFMPRAILHHDNETCWALERNCYYGGELAISRIGTIHGPIWDLDVNSLYPYMMRRYEYPYRLVRYCEQGSLDWLHSRSADYCLAANVTVRSLHYRYPKRHDSHTIYPDGVYQTYLCGPELNTALQNKDIIEVRQCAAYAQADLFTDYVDFFWKARLQARAAGQPHKELIAKLLLNSLYGKFAQRPMRWKAMEQVLPPDRWAQWRMTDKVVNKVREFRSIAGQVQELICEGEPRETCPIIAACVTAFGRQHMRGLRAAAGEGNWYYQDTDSLMVNDAGMDELLLSAQIDKRELGCLKVEAMAERLVIHSPKWYELDGLVKHSGVKLGADPLPMGQIAQWQFDSITDGLRRHSESAIYSTYQKMSTPKCRLDGVAQADGKVLPQTDVSGLDIDIAGATMAPRRLDKQLWWDHCERLLERGTSGG